MHTPCCCKQQRSGSESPSIYGRTTIGLKSAVGSVLGVRLQVLVNFCKIGKIQHLKFSLNSSQFWHMTYDSSFEKLTLGPMFSPNLVASLIKPKLHLILGKGCLCLQPSIEDKKGVNQFFFFGQNGRKYSKLSQF